MRVRFAPSPTGNLHLGGLRTALYNFLVAKQVVQGSFVLRIEDTDQKRLVGGAVDNIIDSLNWAGIPFDEGPGKPSSFGPFFQSMRLESYKATAKQLIGSGYAYKCFCTPERLQALAQTAIKNKVPSKYDGHCRHLSLAQLESNSALPHVIRFKAPQNHPVPFEDFVLLKSDGWPTYHLASVVDDHQMQIDTVLRGKEWLASVPKHLALYESLGWNPPNFFHLPLLLNPDGSKLSKRVVGSVDFNVQSFKSKGYLPQALLNFVALLGWAPEGNKRFFTLPEMIKEFSLNRLNENSSIVDETHLEYLQKLHFQEFSRSHENNLLVHQLRQHLLKKYGTSVPSNTLNEALPNIYSIVRECSYFWVNPGIQETLSSNTGMTRSFLKALEEMSTYSSRDFLSMIQFLMKSSVSHSSGSVLMFLRLLITGTKIGPPLHEIFHIIGPHELRQRCQTHLSQYSHLSDNLSEEN